jgi:hypothetical protein
MDIIKRNFFRLLRSGALNEFESIEPMSAFKWDRLIQMVKAQKVSEIALKGIRNHQYDEEMNIPASSFEELQNSPIDTENISSRLSNRFLNKRLKKIRENEPHAIDASMDTLTLLNIIVKNIGYMLNRGISLNGILEMGRFLRTKGDKVDFVKLDGWLEELHLQHMAQLQGNILISVFKFEQDEIPFVQKLEPEAGKLTLRSLNHTAMDTAKDWHFRQSKSGFVKNNSAVLRKNLRRSIRYINYAPIETTSNFINNFARSLSEIEE